MSRTIPIVLQTMLDGNDWTFADCLEVTQQAVGSSLTLRVTTLNRAIVIGSHRYEPLGYVRKDMSAEDNMGVGNTEVDGILDSDYLTEDDIRAGRWDGAAWRKFRVNYVAPDDGVIELGNGVLGTISWGRLRFTAELLGLMQHVQNSIGRLNSPQCIHDFGMSRSGPGLGNGCTFDLATVTFTGTVGSMDSDFYGIHDGARTEPDATFSNGLFRVMTGQMAGMEFEIRAYIQGFWILFTALPYDVTGEDYEIVQGCDKSLHTCVYTYNNILDRLASDYTQGNDAAVQTARHGDNDT